VVGLASLVLVLVLAGKALAQELWALVQVQAWLRMVLVEVERL
jgi:hypothetical protein